MSNAPKPPLGFYSIAAMERGLDGAEDSFAEYFFALYHCSPDDRIPGGVVELREKLRQQFPKKALPIGDRFVLVGEAAWRALSSYYQAVIECGTLGDDYRAYIRERLEAVTQAHRQSQSLPVPGDLTEGQLANDPRLELLTCVAIDNGQVCLRQSDDTAQ